MRTRVIGIAALAACLAAGAAAAMGQGMHGAGGHGGMMVGPGRMFPALLRNLDLTAEQQQQVRDILGAHRATFRQLTGQVRSANQAVLDRLLAPGSVTAKDLDAQMQQAAQARAKLMQEGIDVALQVRGVLTADQIAKAATIRQKMESLRAQMRELLGKPGAEGE